MTCCEVDGHTYYKQGCNEYSLRLDICSLFCHWNVFLVSTYQSTISTCAEIEHVKLKLQQNATEKFLAPCYWLSSFYTCRVYKQIVKKTLA